MSIFGDEPPEPPWGPGQPPPPPDLPGSFFTTPPDADDRVTLYDYFGDRIGTNDWSGWWDAAVKNTYHDQIHVLNLIQLLEDEYDIEWDWEAWREAYASAHAGV